ncbi:hypothetical protein F5Y15DRAFT_252718 [Xylariaceae sp. FL0016]|nr:hypothetical protein F5Y15DRAFT_252718 [Xylariaceae sp. FL0016]
MFRSSKKVKGPPTIPTDHIVPIHAEDDTPRHRWNVMHILLRIDDGLDPDKLERSLWALLDRPGWCKLGGRLRRNVNKGIDVHIPKRFSATRPPVTFFHQHRRTSINHDSLAAKLPGAAQGQIQMINDTERFLPLMRRPEDPKVIRDYLNSDLPALGVHVVTFTDATLVTLRLSHLLLDIVGIKCFLEAWSAVLRDGAAAVIPPVHGLESSPMDRLAERPAETFMHADRLLRVGMLLLMGLRVLWHWFLQRIGSTEKEEERRIICMPAGYIRSLRETAMQDLENERGLDEKAPFISEGDVLSAWWAKLLTPHVSAYKSQTVAMVNVLELRPLLRSSGWLSEGTIYIGNAHLYVSAFSSAGKVLSNSIGALASAVRRSIVTLGSRSQVEAFMALKEKTPSGFFILGDPGMHMFCSTNWTKAKLYEIDFSGALVKEGSHRLSQEAGRPATIYYHPLEPPQFPMMKILYITGKDAEGNYWMCARLTRDLWARIEKTLPYEHPVVRSPEIC